MKNIFIIALTFFQLSMAQNYPKKLFNLYDAVKDTSFTTIRFKQSHLVERINIYENKLKGIMKLEKVGYSGEGREINLIHIGNGKTKVFLWSQMHGDEPTATMALMDILSYFASNQNQKEVKAILQKTTLLILPMINPDGAERFQRRSVHGIDINRDALALQTSEANILKNVRDKYNPKFGFNLHDQDPWTTAGQNGDVSTIALLTPAYNFEKSTNAVRKRAKHVAAEIVDILNSFIKGKIARYNDDFEPRAFGDNIQKWGTSTVLIESGGYPNDPNKMFIRKLNFVAILTSINSIATEKYTETQISKYESLPENKNLLYDIIIKNITQTFMNSTIKSVKVDIGINITQTENSEKVVVQKATIENKGDLRTYKTFRVIDAKGKKVDNSKLKLNSEINMEEFLKQFN